MTMAKRLTAKQIMADPDKNAEAVDIYLQLLKVYEKSKTSQKEAFQDFQDILTIRLQMDKPRRPVGEFLAELKKKK